MHSCCYRNIYAVFSSLRSLHGKCCSQQPYCISSIHGGQRRLLEQRRSSCLQDVGKGREQDAEALPSEARQSSGNAAAA